ASDTQSYFDGSGVEHHVLERQRPVVNEDVPEGDIVIATWWHTAEWVNSLDAGKGVKVYFIQHHEIFPYLPVDRCHATYSMRMHKIVVAPWLKGLMCSAYGDSIVDVVPNSVDRTQFYAADRGKRGNPTIGFLYSLAPFKGVETALAAINMVRARLPRV